MVLEGVGDEATSKGAGMGDLRRSPRGTEELEH